MEDEMMSGGASSGWIKGITLSIIGSLIGGASKLAIRKSWLMQQSEHSRQQEEVHAPLRQSVADEQQQQSTRESNFDYDLTSTTTSTYSSTSRRLLALLLRSMGVFGMSVLNPFFGIWALNYASPSVLAPLSGLTLVIVILFSPIVLAERPHSRQLHAAALIVLGQVLTAVWGDHTNEQGKTAENVRESYRDPVFCLYLMLFTVFLGGCFYAMRNPHVTLGIKRFCWGISSGALTGLYNFLKDAMILIKAKDEESGWEIPLLVGLSLVVGFTGLGILTVCMKRYDAIYSSSMFVGSLVVSASIMSAIHYDTFSHLPSAASWVLYPAGLIILMRGVYMLATLSSTEHTSSTATVHTFTETTPEVLMVNKRINVATQETNGILT